MPRSWRGLVTREVSPHARNLLLRFSRVAGALLGYGSLAAFIILVGVQLSRWVREGEWTHFGVSEGLRVGLERCCVRDGTTGRLADLVHWLEAPATWLGLHKILEVLPASLLLFALSILGNSLCIYCRDRLEVEEGSERGVINETP